MLFDPSVVIERPLALLGTMFVILIGKTVAAFVIVILFGYGLRTALTISASLAQIGEFSFILVGLGVTLGLLPVEGRDLVLAAALLSITLNPFAFATIDPIARWVGRRPRLAARLDRQGSHAAPSPDRSGLEHLQNHAIIVGYGRVGGVVGHALAAQGLTFVAIDVNRRLVDKVRAAGVTAIFGDATLPGVLETARVEHARLLIIASPDGFHGRQILKLARLRNPQISVVVRTHSTDELAYLVGQGVDRAVMGELELALEMTDYALRNLGVSEDRARTVVQWLRSEGMAGTPLKHD
jgi:CPA2 family monovalent cation:H+ antiporter-2